MDWTDWGAIFTVIVIFYYIDNLRGEVSALKQRLDALEKRYGFEESVVKSVVK